MADTNKKATVRNIAAIARAAAPDAIRKMRELIDNEDPRVALQACSNILDRAVGKPLQMTADVTDRLDDFTDDQLDAAIADLEGRIGIASEPAAEAPATPTAH